MISCHAQPLSALAVKSMHQKHVHAINAKAMSCHQYFQYMLLSQLNLLRHSTSAVLQVDVYSFGVIMWEVVSHEQPSRGRMRNLKVPQECPAEINYLINVCLSEDPVNRPSAKEVYDALKTWRDKHAAYLQTVRERHGSDNTSVHRAKINDSGNSPPSDDKFGHLDRTGSANGSAPSKPESLLSRPLSMPSRPPSLPSGVNPLPSYDSLEAGSPSSEKVAPSAFMHPSQQAQGFS